MILSSLSVLAFDKPSNVLIYYSDWTPWMVWFIVSAVHEATRLHRCSSFPCSSMRMFLVRTPTLHRVLKTVKY